MNMIYAGFPGIGKTYAAKAYYALVDLESSNYQWKDNLGCNTEANKGNHLVRRDNWEDKYVHDIFQLDLGYEDVLISGQPSVLKVLTKKGLNFVTVTPDIRDREIYLKRYEDRGNSDKFIENMSVNFANYIADMDNNQNAVYHVKLGRERYLIDFLSNIRGSNFYGER